jgi:hypothetical protein
MKFGMIDMNNHLKSKTACALLATFLLYGGVLMKNMLNGKGVPEAQAKALLLPQSHGTHLLPDILYSPASKPNIDISKLPVETERHDSDLGSLEENGFVKKSWMILFNAGWDPRSKKGWGIFDIADDGFGTKPDKDIALRLDYSWTEHVLPHKKGIKVEPGKHIDIIDIDITQAVSFYADGSIVVLERLFAIDNVNSKPEEILRNFMTPFSGKMTKPYNQHGAIIDNKIVLDKKGNLEINGTRIEGYLKQGYVKQLVELFQRCASHLKIKKVVAKFANDRKPIPQGAGYSNQHNIIAENWRTELGNPRTGPSLERLPTLHESYNKDATPQQPMNPRTKVGNALTSCPNRF